MARRKAPPKRLRPLLEDIEPRVLMSADHPLVATLAPSVVHGEALSEGIAPREPPALLAPPAPLAPLAPLAPPAPPAPTQAAHGSDATPTDGTSGAVDPAAAAAEFLFIDGSLDDVDTLITDLQRAAGGDGRLEVIRLDVDRDAIDQISEVLARRQGNVAAVHLVGHGEAGAMQFGQTRLDRDLALARAETLIGWQASLTDEADLLLYGCDLAASDDGRLLLEDLALLTGADVAASTNPTGAVELGGDWALEAQVGAIESVLAPMAAQSAWQGVLATYIVTTTADSGDGSLRWAIEQANGNTGPDEIRFNIPGGGVSTILVGAQPLPTITSPVIIDGAIDDSASPGNKRPGIVLNGQNLGSDRSGLILASGASGSTIRGLVIQNFTGNGLEISGSHNNTIAGNWIGLDTAGTGAAGNGNGNDGIKLAQGASNNLIGGTTPGARNIVSGNVFSGIALMDKTTTGNRILGNWIGLGADGSTAVGNGNRGVFLSNVADTEIGDGTAAGRNVISYNRTGVWVRNATSGTRVDGNWITHNTDSGILVRDTSSNTRIGSAAMQPGNPNPGNVIADNGRDGISVTSNSATAASILANQIYRNGSSNDQIGIDLGDNGITANDPGDGDNGPNGLQNFPVLSAVSSAPDGTTFTFSLNSAAHQNYRIDFYANAPIDADASHGEGARWLGAVNVSTDGSGNYPSTAIKIGDTWVNHGDRISATATVDLGGGNYGGTSELAANVTASASGVVVVDTTSDLSDGDTSSITNLGNNRGGDGRISLREAITAANHSAGPTTIRFGIAGANPHTITLGATALPHINRQVLIDGSINDAAFPGGKRPGIVLNGQNLGPNSNGLVLAGSTSSGSVIRGLVIQNFTGAGLRIDSGSSNHTIAGNWIGLDDSGRVARPNGRGVVVLSANNTIGGTTDQDRNVISGNRDGGLRFEGGSATGNKVIGNYIGTTADGLHAPSGAPARVPNTTWPTGVMFIGGAHHNYLGTDADDAAAGVSDPDKRNVISGNQWYGVEFRGAGTDYNVMQGNIIGLDRTGMARLGNADGGIGFWEQASHNRVGGAGTGNVISGNSFGIQIGGGASHNAVQGNIIGLNIAGTSMYEADNATRLSNDQAGIRINDWDVGGAATGNLIGGTGAGEGNLIAHNGGRGITLAGNGTVGNAFLGNRIYGNGLLGIDLGSDEVTNNNAHGSNPGPNNWQHFPVLTGASTDGSGIVAIRGHLNSAANSRYRIELFASQNGDASGHGEGQIYLGFVNVLTDGSGHASFGTTLATAVPVPAGYAISATATVALDSNYTVFGDTSEFAQNILAAEQTVLIVDTALDENDAAAADAIGHSNYDIDALLAQRGQGGTISLREALIAVNNTPPGAEPVCIEFAIQGPGVPTIVLGQALPSIIRPVHIDGSIGDGVSPDGRRPGVVLDGAGLPASGLTLWDNPGGSAIDDASGSTIRGLIIRNFDGHGIYVNGADDVWIAGNWIGRFDAQGALDPAGTGNTYHGIRIEADRVKVGGDAAADRNVVSGNGWNGIEISAGAHRNTIQGNYIGTDASGEHLISNVGSGIRLWGAGTGNRIGGSTLEAGNLVVGTGGAAINVANGSHDSIVQGNRIGLNLSGTVLGQAHGVSIENSSNVVVGADGIGGNDADEGNVIVAPDRSGVVISGASSAGNVVAGNWIGADRNSSTPLGLHIGVSIEDDAHDNRVGGVLPDQANTIRGATSNAIRAEPDAGRDNAFLGNRITGSGGLAIDLGPSGATPNDADDVDGGPDGVQNKPLNVDVVDNGSNDRVRGSLTSAPGQHYRIEFFVSDSSSPGAAQELLGYLNVQTDPITGEIGFDTDLAALHASPGATLVNGQWVSATATRLPGGPGDVDSFGSTSELSAAVQVRPPAPPTSANREITLNEDTPHVFQLGDFAYSDIDDDTFVGVWIDSPPVSGTLTLGAASITTPQWVEVGSIDAGQLVYTPALNANNETVVDATDRSFQFRVQDASGMTSAAHVLSFSITPVNDAPVNTVPGAQVVDEDTTLSITGISVSDVDGNLSTVQLSVAHGTAAVSLASGAVITNGANSSSTLTLSGTQTQINAALATLTYRGNVNYHGSDTLTVLSTDSNSATDADTVAITVNPVNDAPLNTAPGAQIVDEDTTLSITGISVDDVDGNLSTVQLSVSNGTLNVDLAGGATIGAGDNDSATLTLSGTQTQINAALATLTYRGSLDYHGADTLTILSTDSNSATDADTVAITVNPVNDAPRNTVPGPQIVDEDTTLPITGISVSDVDGNLSTVQLSVAHGTLNVNLAGGATIGAGANDSATLTLSGTQTQINAALATLTYRGSLDYHGSDTLIVLSTDSNNAIDADTVAITVNPVNDAPILAPASPVLPSITEDDVNNGGQIVSSLLGTSLIDVDNDALAGIAITGTGNGNGRWQFSLDGSAWTDIGTVSNGSALLLRDTDRIRFVPDGQNATAASFTYRAWDQTSIEAAGGRADTSSNGNATAFSINANTASISVGAVNDAPAIAPIAPNLLPITEDDTKNNGQTVSSFLSSSITDVDTGALTGIAVTGTVHGNGHWEFSTDSGTTWIALGAVSDTSARLLRDMDRIRFVPDGRNGTTASIDYRAWDRTSGTAGSTADASTHGGTTPFSSVGDTASITIGNVNDAPVLVPIGPTLPALTEDDTANTGQTVSSFLGSSITDVDTGDLIGIAITATTNGNGRWEYSLDNGANWAAVGSVSDTSARLLRDSDRIRFVPDGRNGTTASISYRAWDRTSGTAGTATDASVHGGTTPFSSLSDTASITVGNVNDAPVLNPIAPDLSPITEDDTNNNGQTVSSFLGGSITDVDTGALTGIAITATDDGNGHWEFSTANGTTWTAVGAVSDTSARLLRDTDRIRFIPDGRNGTAASLTYYAWDQTSGTAGGTADASIHGGTTAFSVDSDIASLTVAPINDPPMVSVGADPSTYIENAAPAIIDPRLTVTDVDSAVLTGARIRIISGHVAAEDRLNIPAPSGLTATWDAASGVLLLSGTATVAEYEAALRSVTYHNTSDAPSTQPRQISFEVHDGEAWSAPAVQTIAVMPLNDAPALSGPDIDLPALDSRAPVGAGHRIGDLVGSRISDPDPGALPGIAIVGAWASAGQWEYSRDGGQTWQALGAVSADAALLLTVDDRLRLAPQFAVSATASLELRGWDQAAGSAGSRLDARVTGGTTAFSEAGITIRQPVHWTNAVPVLVSHEGRSDVTLTLAGTRDAITTVRATDADEPTQRLRYAIAGGADAARFEVDPDSGLLRWLAPPVPGLMEDADGDGRYVVGISASDGETSVIQWFTVRMQANPGGGPIVQATPGSPAEPTLPPKLPVINPVATGPLSPSGPEGAAYRADTPEGERDERPVDPPAQTNDGHLGEILESIGAGGHARGPGAIDPVGTGSPDRDAVINARPWVVQQTAIESQYLRWIGVNNPLDLSPLFRADGTLEPDGSVSTPDSAAIDLQDVGRAATKDEGALEIDTGLSVGIVFGFSLALWMVRGGALLMSLLLSSPAWRSYDLLPVVRNGRGDDDDEYEEPPEPSVGIEEALREAESRDDRIDLDSDDRGVDDGPGGDDRDDDGDKGGSGSHDGHDPIGDESAEYTGERPPRQPALAAGGTA